MIILGWVLAAAWAVFILIIVARAIGYGAKRGGGRP